jgi:hypothetical protein
MNAIEETMDEDAIKALLLQLPTTPEAVKRRLDEARIRSELIRERDQDPAVGLVFVLGCDELDEIKQILAEFGIRSRRWPRRKYESSFHPVRITILFSYSPAGWMLERYWPR